VLSIEGRKSGRIYWPFCEANISGHLYVERRRLPVVFPFKADYGLCSNFYLIVWDDDFSINTSRDQHHRLTLTKTKRGIVTVYHVAT